jgi:hypothetical protein
MNILNFQIFSNFVAERMFNKTIQIGMYLFRLFLLGGTVVAEATEVFGLKLWSCKISLSSLLISATGWAQTCWTSELSFELSICIPSICDDVWGFFFICRSQWPRGLRHELSSPARMLWSWVLIPL